MGLKETERVFGRLLRAGLEQHHVPRAVTILAPVETEGVARGVTAPVDAGDTALVDTRDLRVGSVTLPREAPGRPESSFLALQDQELLHPVDLLPSIALAAQPVDQIGEQTMQATFTLLDKEHMSFKSSGSNDMDFIVWKRQP